MSYPNPPYPNGYPPAPYQGMTPPPVQPYPGYVQPVSQYPVPTYPPGTTITPVQPYPGYVQPVSQYPPATGYPPQYPGSVYPSQYPAFGYSVPPAYPVGTQPYAVHPQYGHYKYKKFKGYKHLGKFKYKH